MNIPILQQYNLAMRKGQKKYDAYISGNSISNYIYAYRHPDDIEDFIKDINLAINDNYQQIEDQEYSGGNGSHWHAWITPTHFELWQDGFTKTIIPLQDWREILISWKECLEI